MSVWSGYLTLILEGALVTLELTVMGLMGGGLWGLGFVAVDMRIRKLLKRFLATPMRKRDFLAALMISRLLFMTGLWLDDMGFETTESILITESGVECFADVPRRLMVKD